MSTAPPTLAARVPQILSATGVALLCAAALSVVSARWDGFGPGARLAALLVASGVLVAATRQIRRGAPSTARALDVLLAAMVSIDVAAVAIVAGGSWRTALLVAGPTAVAVGRVLQARGLQTVGEVGVGVGACLAAAGLAAEFDLHAPMLIALLALLGAALGEHLRSPSVLGHRVVTGWALVAGFAPAARLFDEAVFTGMGTLREIGLIAPALLAEAAITGTLAVAALIAVACRQRSWPVAIVALGAFLATALELWAITDPPSHVGVLTLAATVALIELFDPRRARIPEPVACQIETINEVALVALTGLVGVGAWIALGGDTGPIVATPLIPLVLAAGWLVGVVRRPEGWGPALFGGVTASSVAVFVATNDPRWFAGALVVSAALSLLSARRDAVAISLATAGIAPVIAFWAGAADIAVVAGAAVLVATGAVVRRAPSEPVIATGVVIALLHGTLAAVTATAAWDVAAGTTVAVVLWSVIGAVLQRVQDAAGYLFRSFATMAPLLLVSDQPTVAVILAAGVTAAAAARAIRSPSRAEAAMVGLGLGVTYLCGLAAIEVDLLDAYLVPLVWVGVAVVVAGGEPRTPAHLVGLGFTSAITIAGRIDDGRSIHLTVLGVTAIAVAVLAGRSADRATLAAASSLAVGAATFELLDRSIGVETWGWLLVGGAAAVAAAAALEARDDVVGDPVTP